MSLNQTNSINSISIPPNKSNLNKENGIEKIEENKTLIKQSNNEENRITNTHNLIKQSNNEENRITNTTPLVKEGCNDNENEILIITNPEKIVNKADEQQTNKPKLLTQLLLCLACSLVQLGVGCIVSFSGVTLPQLTNTMIQEPPLILINNNNNNNNSTTNSGNKTYQHNISNETYKRMDDYFQNVSLLNNNISLDQQDEELYLNFTDLVINQQDFFSFINNKKHLLLNDSKIFKFDVNVTEKFKENYWDLILTKEEATFFSSSVSLGAAIGSLFSGIILVMAGQRNTLLLVLPLMCGTWIIQAVATSSGILNASRVIVGICMGLASVSSGLFMIEVTHYTVRGPLTSCIDFTRNFGILFMYIIGWTQLWWRYQAIIVGLLSTVPSLVILIFLHNSPRWLTVRKRFQQAEKALKFYRGSTYDITKEFGQIRNTISSPTNKSNGVLEQLKCMIQPRVLRLVIISTGVIIGTQSSGNFAVTAYAVPVLSEAVPAIDPYTGAVILGALRTLGGVLMVVISYMFSRRKSYLVSMFICGISMLIIGIHAYLVETNRAPEWTWWVPLFGLSIYFCAMTIATPSCLLLLHELLPLGCRALACGYLDVVFYLAGFIVSQTFLTLKDSIHVYGVFWLYAACSCIMSCVPLLLLPETFGKELEDIENSLNIQNKNNKDDH